MFHILPINPFILSICLSCLFQLCLLPIGQQSIKSFAPSVIFSSFCVPHLPATFSLWHFYILLPSDLYWPQSLKVILSIAVSIDSWAFLSLFTSNFVNFHLSYTYITTRNIHLFFTLWFKLNVFHYTISIFYKPNIICRLFSAGKNNVFLYTTY